jgi:hypothetical protein
MTDEFLHDHGGILYKCAFTHFQHAHMVMVNTPWGSKSRALSGSSPEAVFRSLATELAQDHHKLELPAKLAEDEA